MAFGRSWIAIPIALVILQAPSARADDACVRDLGRQEIARVRMKLQALDQNSGHMIELDIEDLVVDGDYVELDSSVLTDEPPGRVVRKGPPPLPLMVSGPRPVARPGLLVSISETDYDVFIPHGAGGEIVPIRIAETTRFQRLPAPPKGVGPEKQFEQIARAAGKDLDLVPMLDSKGHPVQGGFRQAYIDRKTGRVYKRVKSTNEFDPREYVPTDFEVAETIRRQLVVTDYVNYRAENLPEKLGLGMDVMREGQTFSMNGWTDMENLGPEWKSLHDYRKALPAKSKKAFNQKLAGFKEWLLIENKNIAPMINSKFRGRHIQKGLTKEVGMQLAREAGGDEGRLLALLAERGYLADIDTGTIRLDTPDGLPSDLINCRVKDVVHKGKTIPWIKCFDI